MPQRKLSEAQAWREIARRFENGEASDGLCWNVGALARDGRLRPGVIERMKRRLDTVGKDSDGLYWWRPVRDRDGVVLLGPSGDIRKSDRNRATAAALFAAMAS